MYAWVESLEAWRLDVRRLTGNPVEVLEVSAEDAIGKVAGRGQVCLTSDVRVESCTAPASTSSGRLAVPKPGRTRPVSAAQVRAYAAKAEEFAEAAASDLGG
jgi:hypothetical protein